MEDEMLDEDSPLPEAPPEADIKPDPSQRFKQYLEAQMAGNARRQSPEYLNGRDMHQDNMAGVKDRVNLGALLFDSAGKIGSVAGKPTQSSYGDFAKGLENNVDSSMNRDTANQKEDDLNQTNQTRLYQYLAQQQAKEQALKTGQFNAETKRQQNQQPKWNSLSGAKDSAGFPIERDQFGNTRRIPGAGPQKEAPTSLQETQRTDEDGNPLLFNPKTGGYMNAAAGVKPKPGTKNTAYDALPKDKQTMVQDLQKSNAGKLSIVNQIDSELNNFKSFAEKGNKDQAITAGENMLKVLNSTEGKDAVGAEEAKRLAGFLKFNVLNLSNPGPTFGRDLDQFYTQASSKSNSIKNAIRANQKNIDDLMSGTYDPTKIPDLPTEIGEKTSGKAMAAPIAHPQDNEAVRWAKENPSDPRSAVILKANGM